jgi:nucleotide-binding universal stress UspA family protein
MKTIIVPLDFSNESMTGLNFAMMMSNKTGANIQMVHIIKKNETTPEGIPEKDRQDAKIKLEEILRKCREKSHNKCALSYKIMEGKIFKEIADLADNNDDALIVLSTHGESGYEELFIGGNAYKIISHARTPVLTVRRCRISSNIDKIVLPLDSSFETREKVPYTLMLAKLFNSEIHVLTLNHTKSKSVEKKLLSHAEQVASFIKKQKTACVIEHLHGSNLTDITIDYATSVNADLISIMTEQEKSVSNLLLGNYAHQMINKSIIPVLSFPTYQLAIYDGLRTQGRYY